MRNVTLLDNVSASVQQISDSVNLDKRTDWILTILSDTLDGTPELFIEYGFTGGKCLTPPSEWFILENCCEVDGSFLINDSVIQVNKSVFTANWFRVRVEAEDNTTGNITIKLHYKDYP